MTTNAHPQDHRHDPRRPRHECVQVSNGADALAHLQKSSFDAAFLDLRLGTENGLDLIAKMITLEPKLAVIVFTAYSSIDTAVEAMRRGAVDYLAKPFTPDQCGRRSGRIESARRLENKVVELESLVSDSQALADFNSEEPIVQKLFETATRPRPPPPRCSSSARVARARACWRVRCMPTARAAIMPSSPSPVRASRRSCSKASSSATSAAPSTGAVGETWGKVKAAEGGTLFLDEIGELPMEIQPKLLRLLQEREYERVGDTKPRKANVRVIAATNRKVRNS